MNKSIDLIEIVKNFVHPRKKLRINVFILRYYENALKELGKNV